MADLFNSVRLPDHDWGDDGKCRKCLAPYGSSAVCFSGVRIIAQPGDLKAECGCVLATRGTVVTLIPCEAGRACPTVEMSIGYAAGLGKKITMEEL